MMGNASCLDRHMNSKGESSWEGKVRFPQILLSLLKKKKKKQREYENHSLENMYEWKDIALILLCVAK